MAGYSSRSLAEKLGLKDSFKVCVVGAPESYFKEVKLLSFETKVKGAYDFIHFFTTSSKKLEKVFPELKKALAKTGLIWISWPKLSAKMESDLDENKVQKIGLQNGLVDVKVIAVDETWSGLKFVYRLKDRDKLHL